MAKKKAKDRTKKVEKQTVSAKKSLTYVIAILLSPVALGIIGYFWLLVTSPQHALVKSNQAIKSKNLKQFQTYTDHKKVAQSLSLALLNLSPEQLTPLIGAEKVKLFLNTPASEIEKTITQSVDLYFKGQKVLVGKSLVEELLVKLSFDDLWFAGVEVIDEDSNPVKVTIRFSVFAGAGTVKPTLYLKENKKNWYVADIANSEQFIAGLIQVAMQPKKPAANIKALSNY